MHRLVLLLASLLAATAGVLAGAPVNKSLFGSLAVDGYDVVAFFTDGKAVRGDKSFQVEHEGARYRFASAEHLAAFKAAPDKYLPAYGGYCAWAVSEKKSLAPVDIDTWQIVDGRLFLNYDAAIREKFDADRARHIRQADANWKDIAAKEK